MPPTINPLSYIVGAAEVYWRAIASLGPWTYGGATRGDVTFRVRQTYFNAADDINGVLEPIYLMDYKSKGGPAECEFEMLEVAGAKLAIPITGATATAGVTTATGGGGSSTLSAATVAGATTVAVASATNFAVGDYIKVDVGALAEYRRITAIASLNISFRDPLLLAHASGVAAVETDGDGKTEIVPGTARRQPASAYNDFVLVAQSPADYYELYLYNAISRTEAAEMSFGNDNKAGVKVTVASRQDGSNLALPSWRMRVPVS